MLLAFVPLSSSPCPTQTLTLLRSAYSCNAQCINLWDLPPGGVRGLDPILLLPSVDALSCSDSCLARLRQLRAPCFCPFVQLSLPDTDFDPSALCRKDDHRAQSRLNTCSQTEPCRQRQPLGSATALLLLLILLLCYCCYYCISFSCLAWLSF